MSKHISYGIRLKYIVYVSAVFLWVFPSEALSDTWYVAADSTGQFTVIQDAVDIAAPGDTIMIGPGQYVDYTEDGGWHYYVDINYKQDLTFIGAGQDQTIIGPETYSSYEDAEIGIYGHSGLSDLRVSDIKFLNLNDSGIRVYNLQITTSNCAFENCYIPIFGILPSGGLIEDCRFDYCGDGISIHAPSSGVVIKECIFTEMIYQVIGFHWSPNNNHEVLSCTISGGAWGIQFDNGASGSVRGCTIQNQSGKGITVGDDCHVVMEDNWIEQGVPNNYPFTSAIGISGSDLYIEGQGNVVISGRSCFFFSGYGTFDLQYNHFLRGNEEAWYVRVNEPYPLDYRVNLGGNYWGTTDEEEIAAWIYDGHDSEDINLVVEYWPILQEPVVGVDSPLPVQANPFKVWPNPFNPRTTLGFSNLQAGHVRLAVYDLRGREVVELLDEVRSAGAVTVPWDGRDAHGVAVASGVYIARLETSAGVSTQKLVLAR